MTIDVKILRAAGISDRQILDALEIEQAERLARQREQNRIRQRNHRARNAVTRDQRDPSPLFSPPSPPSLNNPPPLTPTLFPLTDSPATALRTSDWPKDFREQFWKAYPRREEKKAAIAKLEAIRKTGLPWEKFYGGVVNYAKHVNGAERQYVKQPTTWLNRGCWDDDFKLNGFGERRQQESVPRPIRQPREEHNDGQSQRSEIPRITTDRRSAGILDLGQAIRRSQ